MKLLILFVFIGTTFGNNVTEEKNDVTSLKFQYLEERIHSLEQPGNILLSQPGFEIGLAAVRFLKTCLGVTIKTV
jgi:hypothetical protein